MLAVWFLVAVMRGFVLFPQRGVLLVFTCDWGCVGVVDKCWRMSLRSLLVRATIWGFRPSPPPFFVCVSRRRESAGTRRTSFVPYWVVHGHKKRRRGCLSCVGVECFEVLILRYGGMPAPRVLMGYRKGFPAGFLWGWQHVFFRVLFGAARKDPLVGLFTRGLLIT